MADRGVVICIGVTPALQRTIRFKDLQIGEVNRSVARGVESASGKATNVARALQKLNKGKPGPGVDLIQFIGGDAGKKYKNLLEFEAYDVLTQAETRTCQTLLVDGDGSATELVEEAINPTEAEWSDLLRILEERISSIKPSGLALGVLTGSPPPSAEPTKYKQILQAGDQAGLRFILDCQKRPLIEALSARPWLVKINEEELEKTTIDLCRSEADLLERVSGLIHAGAQNVVITRGKDEAWFVPGKDLKKHFKMQPPAVKAVNPIASGDSMAAGIAFYMCTRDSPDVFDDPQAIAEAVRFGLACGSANAENINLGDIEYERVAQLASGIEIKDVLR